MKISLKPIIFLFLVILLLHILATVNFWYWNYWWFDIPMHLLGGTLLAMFFLWLKPEFTIKNPSFKKIPLAFQKIVITLAFVALIAVFWEWYEFIWASFFSKEGLNFVAAHHNVIDVYVDTLKDLFFSILGALVVSILATKE